MVIAEPVQNGRGCLVPPDGYWQELRRICDKYGVLLCADEVICSFGRLGHFFGSERFGVVPDMITFAKGSRVPICLSVGSSCAGLCSTHLGVRGRPVQPWLDLRWSPGRYRGCRGEHPGDA